MSDVDDFTELVDFVPDRVDLVGKAANGTEILVAKSADGEPVGLFEPEFVRELVAKAEAEEGAAAPTPVTLSGSPAAVADLMRRMRSAPVRKAEMSTADINELPDSAFAHIEPGGKKDAEGKTTPRNLRHYPVHDEAHAKDALGRAQAQIEGGKPDGKRIAQAAMPKIKAAAKKFGVAVTKAFGDPTDPGSPAWEGQDAESAHAAIQQILGCIPAVQALAQREGAEVGNGHTEDLCDVMELQEVQDLLTCAAKKLAGFKVGEMLAAGQTVTKAQPPAPAPAATAATSPKENTVDTTTTTEVAKAEGTAATGTEQAQPQTQPISKAAALAALGFSEAQLLELGAQAVLKAAQAGQDAATQTTGAAGAPADTARVIPGTGTVQAPAQPPASDDVAKAQANDLVAALTQALAPVVKQVGDLATQVNAQQTRVEKAMQRPDDRITPALNGATGAPQLAERNHANSPVNSPEFKAVLKAVNELPEGEVRESAQAAVGIAAIKARFGHAG